MYDVAASFAARGPATLERGTPDYAVNENLDRDGNAYGCE